MESFSASCSAVSAAWRMGSAGWLWRTTLARALASERAAVASSKTSRASRVLTRGRQGLEALDASTSGGEGRFAGTAELVRRTGDEASGVGSGRHGGAPEEKVAPQT